MTKGFLDSEPLLKQPRTAPPVGRALRIVLGLVLLVYVTPVYFKVPVQLAVESLLLMLGLVGVYSLVHIGVSRGMSLLVLASGPSWRQGCWWRFMGPAALAYRFLAAARVS